MRRSKPATRQELEAIDFTDTEIEGHLKERVPLEKAVRKTRECRLLARLHARLPCGKCLKDLGEGQRFTWDEEILAWVHLTCWSGRA